LDSVAAVNWDAYEGAAEQAFKSAETPDELEAANVEFLGRKSTLKLELREVRDRETGMKLNAVRERVEAARDAAAARISKAELEERLATERVDVTLPAELLGPPKLRPRGTLHPSTLVRRDVEDIFLGLGYEIVDGREIETTR
jgi:phenylalanyl-tRNA synthetase alpha chain